MKTKEQAGKEFRELLKNSKPLTEEEVQELRNKAKKYAESGGKYLDKQVNLIDMDNKEKIRLAINQIPINNCDGSVNEDAIKAIRYLQEVSQALTIPVVVVSEAELCDNPHCEDGVVDSDMYGHPIYCQVCDKHN